jgi:type II secretory pathway component GspD/PulD (secretin)
LIDTDFVNTTRPAGFGQFTRLPFNFNAILDAMVVKKEAKILARPSVMVIDGDESNVFIGDTIRARIAQAGGLGAQTVEIVEFPVGIILLLRPRVNADGNITMRVHPVVSTITAIDDDNIPQTSTREAETTVMVKDGETVIIGGLIRDEMSRTIQEVPILSKLPIIGELFRNRSTSKRKSEIMVLITPHLVKDNDRRPGN